MRDIVKTLGKAQELELVIEESKIIHSDSMDREQNIESLKNEIDQLLSDVPQEQLQRFRKLRSAGLAVVTEDNGICLGCRLNINQGDLNRMRAGATAPMCPNCGRFIILSDK